MARIQQHRTVPRGDVIPVLTVLERKVYIEMTLPGGRTVRRRTKLGVRTVEEWRRVMRRISQRHRLLDERHSGLGLPFDPRNPRFIIFPQILSKERIPRDILARYDHDIARDVRRKPDGSVDMGDLMRKRSAQRLRTFGRRAREAWTVVTIMMLGWTDEKTRAFRERFGGKPDIRRRPEDPGNSPCREEVGPTA